MILPQAERILSLSIPQEMSLMFISPNDHLVVTARVGVTSQALPQGIKAGSGPEPHSNMHSHALSASPLTSSPVLAGFIK